MRLIHTADWHLGRILHGNHLTEDQAHVLEQFCAFVADAKPDAVLIAGDIYDRAVPPPDAVRLLDETLTQLALDGNAPICLIAGNHDSPDRLGFGARILAERGVHVAGQVRERPTRVSAAGGTVVLVPYAEPGLVREVLKDETVQDQHTAMAAQLALAPPTGESPTVVVAHCFAAGGSESESERPLSVGGAQSVDPGLFEPYDYVALGHLHRPQEAGAPHVRYSGSLLKYSFSESEHDKGVLLIDAAKGRPPQIEHVRLTPRRDLRTVRGCIDALLERGRNDPGREDYLRVVLEDDGLVLDAMGRLREVYPNTLHIERPLVQVDYPPEARRERGRRGDLALFTDFYEAAAGEALNEGQEKAFNSVVDDLLRKEREAQS